MTEDRIGPMIIRLKVENGNGEWVTVAEKMADTPQQGNPFKSMMKHAVRPVRIVQEVRNEEDDT